MDRLQYIGKSNKKFTHNHTYSYFGCYYGRDDIFNIEIYSNKNQIIHYNSEEYFNDNFKIMNEDDYNKLIRKLKLKKIKRNG